MVYLVTAKDGVLRLCPSCALVRTIWIGVEGEQVIVACTVCQRVLEFVALERKT